jgi:predicted ribosomally synthesized peptide with SipW-like signal peptide
MKEGRFGKKFTNYKKRKKMKKRIKQFSSLLVAVLLIFNLVGTLTTHAYFSDTETSEDNIFTAGILDLTMRSGQSNFVSNADNMQPGNQVNRDMYVGKTSASLDIKHNVSFEFVDGNSGLCDQLDLKIWYNYYNGPVGGGYSNRDMRLKYNDKLSSLIDNRDEDFIISHPDDQFDDDPSDGTEQWLYYSITLPSDIADSFQGQMCDFKFIFDGWQDNLTDNTQGFTDTEEISNTIWAGYWEPDVVMNEFLPNPIGHDCSLSGVNGEWVELYNNSVSQKDLAGWYLEDTANHTIPIQVANTMDSSTSIGANEWMVVFMNGCILNDDGDTITLYDSNDIQVDTYTYTGSSYNVNDTLGGTNDMALYLPFDGNATDLSGNGNDGTDYSSGFVGGKINQAVSFDGVDDYVEVADSTSLNPDIITLETWIKTSTSGRWQAIASKWYYHGNERQYWLGINNGNKAEFFVGNGSSAFDRISSASIVTDGDWHHVVGVYDGTNVNIFIDGTQENTKITSVVMGANNKSARIGASHDPSHYFNGLIDEVKIYDRALDSAEVLKHYDTTNPLSTSVPENKSYARIPDGTGPWIDPVPTLGAPNILTEEDVESLLEQGIDVPESVLPFVVEGSGAGKQAPASLEQEINYSPLAQEEGDGENQESGIMNDPSAISEQETEDTDPSAEPQDDSEEEDPAPDGAGQAPVEDGEEESMEQEEATEENTDEEIVEDEEAVDENIEEEEGDNENQELGMENEEEGESVDPSDEPQDDSEEESTEEEGIEQEEIAGDTEVVDEDPAPELEDPDDKNPAEEPVSVPEEEIVIEENEQDA